SGFVERDLKGVKTLLRDRHIAGIEGNQILRPQIAEDLVEGLVERRPERRLEYPASGAQRERGQSILTADVASHFIRDRDYKDRVNHRIRQLRGLGRALEIAP